MVFLSSIEFLWTRHEENSEIFLLIKLQRKIGQSTEGSDGFCCLFVFVFVVFWERGERGKEQSTMTRKIEWSTDF
jgi:hypothetical protein